MEFNSFLRQWPPRHHAYAISSINIDIQDIAQEIRTKEVSYVYDRFFDVFTINDARMIKELQSEKTDTASVFVIGFSVINTEAQNALLKVLEEPAPNTYFFILYPNIKQLLPTLQSRLEVLQIVVGESTIESVISAEEFISLPLNKRFDWIKEKTDSKAGEEKLTKEQVKQLLYNLEQYFSKKEHTSPETIEVIYEAQRCINANGASIKMILDMVATNL